MVEFGVYIVYFVDGFGGCEESVGVGFGEVFDYESFFWSCLRFMLKMWLWLLVESLEVI